MKNEVINNYFDIAVEKGWVKTSESRIDKTDNKDYQDKIRALYGIELKTNESDKSLIEQAHPNRVVVAPSHDKMNGLVENIQERQDIIMSAINKLPPGQFGGPKYADQKLLNELTRIGFEMELKDLELRSLADNCSQKLIKEAFWPAFLAGAGSAATAAKYILTALSVIGTVAYVKENFIGHISQGLKVDADRTIKALSDLNKIASPTSSSQLKEYITIFVWFKDKINLAENVLSKLPSINIDKLESTEDLYSVVSTAEDIQASPEDTKTLEKFYNVCQKLGSDNGIIDIVYNFVNDIQLQNQEEDSEWWSTFKSWIWNPVAGNEKSEALNCLSALKKSLIKTISDLASKNLKNKEETASKAQEIITVLESSKSTQES
jgi:hypothetical protein